MKVKVNSLSHVRLFATPWTVAYQALSSMGFSRQECWSGLPFPSPGDLPDPGIKPGSPSLQADALPSEPVGCPKKMIVNKKLQKLGNDLKVYHPTSSVLVSLLHTEVKFECLLQTQRDGMGREVGGGFRTGNTCTPVTDLCQCMATPIQYCKVISLPKNN